MQAKLPSLIKQPLDGFLMEFAICGHVTLAKNSLKNYELIIRKGEAVNPIILGVHLVGKALVQAKNLCL